MIRFVFFSFLLTAGFSQSQDYPGLRGGEGVEELTTAGTQRDLQLVMETDYAKKGQTVVGSFIAVSSNYDGNRIAVADSSGVTVFEIVNGNWEQYGSKISSSTTSLAISGNGSYLVFSNPSLDDKSGEATLYDISSSNFTQLKTWKGIRNQRLGDEVSITHDGQMVAVFSAYGGPNKSGSVTVYEKINSSYVKKGNDIVDSTISNKRMVSAAISDDGSTIATVNDKLKKVNAFQFVGNVWEALGSFPSTRGTLALINSDGTVLGASSPESSGRKGIMKIFKYTTSWVNHGSITQPTKHLGYGSFAGMSDDGTRIAGAAYGKSGDVKPQASVFVHEYSSSSGTWGKIFDYKPGVATKLITTISGNGNSVFIVDESTGMVAYTDTEPTSPPTHSPTPQPTPSPTPSPTVSPTNQPTRSSTSSPTNDAWAIEDGVVGTSDSLIQVSHVISSGPKSAIVELYEEDCSTELNNFVYVHQEPQVVLSSSVSYEFNIDFTEVTSYADLDEAGQSGSFTFCSKLSTQNEDGLNVAFKKIRYYVTFDLATFSFSVNAVVGSINENSLDLGDFGYSVTGCECDEEFVCTVGEYVQNGGAPEVHICLIPSETNVMIVNMDLAMTSSLSGYLYEPVTKGLDGPDKNTITQIRTREDERGYVTKVNTLLVDGLFDGGNTIAVNGNAVVQIVGGKKDEPSERVINSFTINIVNNDSVKRNCFQLLLARLGLV